MLPVAAIAEASAAAITAAPQVASEAEWAEAFMEEEASAVVAEASTVVAEEASTVVAEASTVVVEASTVAEATAAAASMVVVAAVADTANHGLHGSLPAVYFAAATTSVAAFSMREATA